MAPTQVEQRLLVHLETRPAGSWCCENAGRPADGGDPSTALGMTRGGPSTALGVTAVGLDRYDLEDIAEVRKVGRVARIQREAAAIAVAAMW